MRWHWSTAETLRVMWDAARVDYALAKNKHGNKRTKEMIRTSRPMANVLRMAFWLGFHDGLYETDYIMKELDDSMLEKAYEIGYRDSGKPRTPNQINELYRAGFDW